MVRFRRKQDPAPGRRQPAAADKAGRSVFSYHANRVAAPSREAGNSRSYSSQPAKPTKQAYTGPWYQRRWVRNLPSLVALIAVGISLLYCLGLTTNAKINYVGVTRDDGSLTLRGKDEYQQGATEILQDSIFNRTKFTINTQHFEKAFRERFPEVADVAITIPLISRRPVVNVSTAQPQLVLLVQNQAYVLDRRGMAIMKAESLPSDTRSKLPQVKDETGTNVEIGQGVLPTEDITFITEVTRQLNAKNLTVESIVLPARAHQVDVRLAGVPYVIKFSVDTGAREAVGTYLATKAQLEKDKINPAEYVDVRVDGRAYYK